MRMFQSPARRSALIGIALAAALAAIAIPMSAGATGRNVTRFQMHVNPAVKNCVQIPGSSQVPTVEATVKRGNLNDSLDLQLKHFKPNLAFDLFTVEKSNQTSNGTVINPFPNFGLAWYQSDVEVGRNGSGHVHIRTVLLDQIFGFDPAVGLGPTNTFHLGFWFNNPADATRCGFTGFTPFNGEHHAGPLAFVTRPNARTNLGPLCTSPSSGSGGTFTCNP
jgi:hypothetical protein